MQGQHAVHDEGAVQRHSTNRVLPHQSVDPPVGFHGVHRPQTEAVIDEVGNDVGREDQPRIQAQSPFEHGIELSAVATMAIVDAAAPNGDTIAK